MASFSYETRIETRHQTRRLSSERERRCRFLALSLIAAGLMGFGFDLSKVSAEDIDVVVLRSKIDGSNQIKTGEIVQYDRGEVRLKLASGKIVRLSNRNVLRVDTRWNEQHVAANQWVANQEFEKAFSAYAEAAKAESRSWVIEKIFQQRIDVALNLNRPQVACRDFLRLISSHAETPFFHAIPLSWSSARLDAAFELEAQSWLDASSNEVKTLLGCSWSLHSRGRFRAIEKLKILCQSKQLEIAQLAKAQLWRTEIPTATEAEADRWEAEIRTLDFNLRAGPYFVLAQVQKRLNQHDKAVANLMRLPVLYSNQYQLAALALHQAALLLKSQNDPANAERLLKELAQDFRQSQIVSDAGQRIDDKFEKTFNK